MMWNMPCSMNLKDIVRFEINEGIWNEFQF